MKNLYIFLLVLACFTGTKAQYILDPHPWCPPGATWVYRSVCRTCGLFYAFQYVSDTVILDKTVKTLKVSQIEYMGIPGDIHRVVTEVGKEYMYNSNDSIFWFYPADTEFIFIYDFSFTVGDSWIARNPRASCPDDTTYPISDTLSVLSIIRDTSTIDSTVSQLSITSTNNFFDYTYVLRNIGSLYSPFPRINPRKCSDVFSEYGEYFDLLSCYSDSLRGILNFGHITECNTLLGGLSRRLKDEDEKLLLVYPNPAYNIVQLHVDAEYIDGDFSIFDMQGRVIFESPIYDLNLTVDVTQLQPGLYFIRVRNPQRKERVSKFIKQEP